MDSPYGRDGKPRECFLLSLAAIITQAACLRHCQYIDVSSDPRFPKKQPELITQFHPLRASIVEPWPDLAVIDARELLMPLSSR